MKTNLRIRHLALVFLVFGSTPGNAQDGPSILKQMDRVMYGPRDMTGTNKLVLIDKSGKEESREALIKQKGSDMRIMRFTAPASQAGISVLALPNDVMYMYLPAFGKERRIAGSIKNQNFAGTDFSYDDMEPIPYSDKYVPTLKGSEGDAYLLELVPKNRSSYSRILARVHREHFYPLRMEYYDQGGTKIKEATYVWKKVGTYWSSAEIEMTDLKKGHRTKMLMSDVVFDSGLSDDEFTVRKLTQ
ncbi:MAG: outer membrane lipoprotein-sorting protein [Bacteroidales bacterium]